MNTTRIDQEDGVAVLEIKPMNSTLRIVFSLILGLLAVAGIGLVVYTYNVYQHISSLWLSPRLGLALMAFFFVFFIFFRHWIWFNKGKEVVVVYPDRLLYYRDFVLFAEGKSKTPYQRLEVIYRKDDEAAKRSLDGDLVDDLITAKRTAIIGFRLDGDKVVSTNLPVPLEDVQQLTDLLRS